jgi:hypothetical protein
LKGKNERIEVQESRIQLRCGLRNFVATKSFETDIAFFCRDSSRFAGLVEL